MLGGIILNYIAIFGIAYISYKILNNLFPDKIEINFSLSLFFGILIFHSDISGVAGWAFETVYSGLVMMFLIYLISKKDIDKNINLIILFYIIGHLFRPENLIIFSPLGLWLLFKLANTKKVLFTGLKVICGFLFLFLFKYFVFDDIFPTGYYRKFINLNQEISSGTKYVSEWLFSAPFYHRIKNLYLAIGVFFVLLYISYKYKSESIYQGFFGLIFISFMIFLLNILFCLKTTPMIGYFNRYLISSNVILIFFIFSLLSFIVSKIFSQQSQKYLSFLVLPFFILLSIKERGLKGAVHNLFIIDNLKSQYENHPYIKFGTFLRTNFPNHQNLTLSFGDGGALPYSAQCNTVDPAGLTEPYIARLAAYNGSDKVLKYSNHILSNKLDMFCLATEFSDTVRNVEGCFYGAHVPLSPEQIVEFYSILAKNKFVYVCSISAEHEGLPYDIHLLLNPGSPNFSSLSRVVKEYCRTHGFIREGDFIVECGKQRAVFPNLSR